MARRRRPESQTVSLFPFLSVLACVIGVLTLLITSLALGQMNTASEDEAVRRAESYLAIRKRLPKAEAREQHLRQQIARAKALHEDLETARAERDRLRKLAGTDGTKPDALLAQLQAEIERLKKRIKELKAAIEQRRENIQPLKEELAERENPPESEVVIHPGGTGKATQTRPTFVEANSTGIVIYKGETPHRVTRGDIPKDPEFETVCKQVAASDKGIVVFLIRSDGYGTYGRANSVARSRGARTGKLPVVGQGNIDLHLFKKKG